MISIQTQDFDISQVYRQLRESDPKGTGAICTFTGLVRDFGDGSNLEGIELEHYPAMTQKSLEEIIELAKTRWKIIDTCVIHRIGKLYVGEQIVLVGVCASHRADAFAATEFIMDFLKAQAPFWKKELKQGKAEWVEAKSSDKERAEKWKK